tara:strand:+ start:622 stop:813 length:192 start_codon:yes stop_codon:yes gene_type:complete
MLNREQRSLLSNYTSDISKILFGTAIVGYFIPSAEIIVTSQMFIGGSLSALIFLSGSLILKKQ